MLMNSRKPQAAAVQSLADLWERVGCHMKVRPLPSAAPGTRASVNNPIPGETERPRFVVLDDEYQAADGTRYRPGVWHFGAKPGRGNAPPTLTQQRISGPLHIEAVTFDSAGNNFGRLLRFRDTRGHWRQWAMPMEMLKGDGADLRGVLLSMGVYIDPSQAGRQSLAVYLQNQTPVRQMEAATQTGWAGGDFKAFALPDGVIGPRAARVTFQAQGCTLMSTPSAAHCPAGRRLSQPLPWAIPCWCCRCAVPSLALCWRWWAWSLEGCTWWATARLARPRLCRPRAASGVARATAAVGGPRPTAWREPPHCLAMACWHWMKSANVTRVM